ncbi:DUF2818 family protein [Hydrogenophaga sp. 5NK40-0174]|uniref:DUF2818 family protein n=1 Tax=Hydrogenophaga sp. 5NK40-0174 TaxID=3127649 RepID=UPI00310460E8
MSSASSVWIVLLAAIVAANLPFLSNRWMLVVPARPSKPLWGRLLELVVWYFLVGGIGLFLEQTSGQIYPQGWEFYATTVALFVTLAFPGFVMRYLFKRHH